MFKNNVGATQHFPTVFTLMAIPDKPCCTNCKLQTWQQLHKPEVNTQHIKHNLNLYKVDTNGSQNCIINNSHWHHCTNCGI